MMHLSGNGKIPEHAIRTKVANWKLEHSGPMTSLTATIANYFLEP